MNAQAKGTSLILKVVAIIWLIWVFLDYWFKHPLYTTAFGNVKFAIPMVHLLVGVGAFFIARNWVNTRLNVLHLLAAFLAFLWCGTLVDLTMYGEGIDYSIVTIVGYLGRTLLYVGILFLVTLSAYVAGKVACEKVAPKTSMSESVHVAVGLSFFMVAIFIVLAFKLFYQPLVALVFLAPLFLFFGSTQSAIKEVVKPIQFGDENPSWIVAIVLFILLMNAITFGYTLSPFPVGFDAQKYYINLPKLMAEAGGLQSGYQPYNWSLIQAAGYKLTGRVEMLLIFSWYGLLLVQYAIWQFGRRSMALSGFQVTLAVLLFTFMPSVTQQASQELKIDLVFTFYLLAMMMTTFDMLKAMRADGDRLLLVSLAALIGWLAGVALGIKLTAVIALFGILAILWYQALGRYAFIGFFLFFMGVAFFAQLDTKAGLRVFHDSVQWLQILCIFSGLGFIIYAFRQHVKRGLKLLYISTVIGMTASFVFTPWLLKNYTEIKQPTMMKLLNGTSHGPEINMRIIDKNLKKIQEDDSK